MHMKYFQALADIKRHYDDILQNFEIPYGHFLLETWGINPNEKDPLIEERDALRYLLACQGMMAHDENAKKPEILVINRCLERHLGFLEKVHKCHAYNVNQHRLKIIRKQYKACRHYLFKFTLPAWVKGLPDEVLSFKNKYPDFR
jgi:hypothetical protein